MTFLVRDALNRLATAQNQVSNNVYDAAGNLISIPGVASYTYDAENHLLTAGGVTYTYDGDGQRLVKSSGTTYWYGAGSDPLFETDSSGYQIYLHYYFNGQRIGRREAWAEGFWVDHYAYDALGNARFVYSFDGIDDESVYYPFGGERVISSGGHNQFKFTSKERDPESGLDNFEARYMSSSMGRFMSPDWSAKEEPIPYAKLDNPQSLNLYSYVLNNPLNNVDIDGHACSGVLGNTGSGFCTRAAEYAKIDASPAVQSQTRFFAAANAVSQSLADVDAWSPLVRVNRVSAQTATFLEGVGQKLQGLNEAEAHLIAGGSLTGPRLDQQLVHNEQTVVQGQLDALKQAHPDAYNKTISEINGALNPGKIGKETGSLYPTDAAFQKVLEGVRRDLGRNIDFSRQSDREAIGNALIDHIRQPGGCDVNVEKPSGC